MTTPTVILYLLWMVISIRVPSRCWQKGYVWRLLRKLPPWSYFPADRILDRLARWNMLLVVLTVGAALVDLPYVFVVAAMIVLELDDWLNGDDDDRRRRWKAVRNRIKWLMELPTLTPEPT